MHELASTMVQDANSGANAGLLSTTGPDVGSYHVDEND